MEKKLLFQRFIKAFTFTILIIGGLRTYAQQQISGKVIDDQKDPLIGVSITVKGAAKGTTTDAAGVYKLDVASGSTLVFSYVGFLNKEVVVGNQTIINLTLEADNKAIGELVVVGYGTQRKQDITSAVSVISMKDIGEQQIGRAHV